jgi:hypothetical protein
MRTNVVRRTAALVVGLEGAALVTLAVWQIIALASGDTASIESAIALVALTVIGAAAVVVFAAAVWRGLSWGRSGAIVTQVLILAVALGAATGAYAHPSTAAILAVPAVVALVLLVITVRDAGRAERDAASG